MKLIQLPETDLLAAFLPLYFVCICWLELRSIIHAECDTIEACSAGTKTPIDPLLCRREEKEGPQAAIEHPSRPAAHLADCGGGAEQPGRLGCRSEYSRLPEECQQALPANLVAQASLCAVCSG